MLLMHYELGMVFGWKIVTLLALMWCRIFNLFFALRLLHFLVALMISSHWSLLQRATFNFAAALQKLKFGSQSIPLGLLRLLDLTDSLPCFFKSIGHLLSRKLLLWFSSFLSLLFSSLSRKIWPWLITFGRLAFAMWCMRSLQKILLLGSSLLCLS